MVTTATIKQVAVIQIMDLKTRFQNSPIKLNSCRTDFCTAKFGHLKVELEEAQVRWMTVLIKMMMVLLTEMRCQHILKWKEQTNKEKILNTFSVNSSQAQIKQLECQLADHGIR